MSILTPGQVDHIMVQDFETLGGRLKDKKLSLVDLAKLRKSIQQNREFEYSENRKAHGEYNTQAEQDTHDRMTRLWGELAQGQEQLYTFCSHLANPKSTTAPAELFTEMRQGRLVHEIYLPLNNPICHWERDFNPITIDGAMLCRGKTDGLVNGYDIVTWYCDSKVLYYFWVGPEFIHGGQQLHLCGCRISNSDQPAQLIEKILLTYKNITPFPISIDGLEIKSPLGAIRQIEKMVEPYTYRAITTKDAKKLKLQSFGKTIFKIENAA